MKRNKSSLGGQLSQATKGLSPAQMRIFRAALIKQLPQVLDQARHEATHPGPDQDQAGSEND